MEIGRFKWSVGECTEEVIKEGVTTIKQNNYTICITCHPIDASDSKQISATTDDEDDVIFESQIIPSSKKKEIVVTHSNLVIDESNILNDEDSTTDEEGDIFHMQTQKITTKTSNPEDDKVAGINELETQQFHRNIETFTKDDTKPCIQAAKSPTNDENVLDLADDSEACNFGLHEDEFTQNFEVQYSQSLLTEPVILQDNYETTSTVDKTNHPNARNEKSLQSNEEEEDDYNPYIQPTQILELDEKHTGINDKCKAQSSGCNFIDTNKIYDIILGALPNNDLNQLQSCSKVNTKGYTRDNVEKKLASDLLAKSIECCIENEKSISDPSNLTSNIYDIATQMVTKDDSIDTSFDIHEAPTQMIVKNEELNYIGGSSSPVKISEYLNMKNANDPHEDTTCSFDDSSLCIDGKKTNINSCVLDHIKKTKYFEKYVPSSDVEDSSTEDELPEIVNNNKATRRDSREKNDVKNQLFIHDVETQRIDEPSGLKVQKVDFSVEKTPDIQPNVHFEDEDDDLTQKIHDVETQRIEIHDADTQIVQIHNADTKRIQIHDADTQIVQIHNADTKRIQIHDADMQIVQIHNSDTQRIEIHDADTQIVQIHNADTQRIEMSAARNLRKNSDDSESDILFAATQIVDKQLENKTVQTYPMQSVENIFETLSPIKNSSHKLNSTDLLFETAFGGNINKSKVDSNFTFSTPANKSDSIKVKKIANISISKSLIDNLQTPNISLKSECNYYNNTQEIANDLLTQTTLGNSSKEICSPFKLPKENTTKENFYNCTQDVQNDLLSQEDTSSVVSSNVFTMNKPSASDDKLTDNYYQCTQDVENDLLTQIPSKSPHQKPFSNVKTKLKNECDNFKKVPSPIKKSFSQKSDTCSETCSDSQSSPMKRFFSISDSELDSPLIEHFVVHNIQKNTHQGSISDDDEDKNIKDSEDDVPIVFRKKVPKKKNQKVDKIVSQPFVKIEPIDTCPKVDDLSPAKQCRTSKRIKKGVERLIVSMDNTSTSNSPILRTSKRKNDQTLKIADKTATAETSSTPKERKRKLATETKSTSPKKSFTSYKIMCTSIDVPKYINTIKKLGGEVVEKDCNILVASEPCRRTGKFMIATSLGIPIVSVKWITESNRLKTFQDPWMYLVNCDALENKYKFKLQNVLETASPYLTGWFVFITPSVIPAPAELEEIIKANGGQVELINEAVSRRSSTFSKSNKKVITVSNEKDNHLWNILPKPILSTECIMMGAFTHTLETKKYCLKK